MFIIKNGVGLAFASFLFFTSTAAGAAECPTLDTGNIGDAACSSNSMPFLTAPLASVVFSATTPCPIGLGLKKKLQTIFKGKKEYPASDIKVLNKGEASCTYKLTEDWKKALKTEVDNLVLKLEFSNRENANYWSAPHIGGKCPALEASDADNIRHGTIHVESKNNTNISFEFKVVPYETYTFSNPFSSLKLADLKGVDSLITPYEVKCEYTYHSGSEETKIELVGKQRK